ncbi:unnamed protein product, partial [Didymodactylos carnosus]
MNATTFSVISETTCKKACALMDYFIKQKGEIGQRPVQENVEEMRKRDEDLELLETQQEQLLVGSGRDYNKSFELGVTASAGVEALSGGSSENILIDT